MLGVHHWIHEISRFATPYVVPSSRADWRQISLLVDHASRGYGHVREVNLEVSSGGYAPVLDPQVDSRRYPGLGVGLWWLAGPLLEGPEAPSVLQRSDSTGGAMGRRCEDSHRRRLGKP